jgi:hypothetical protein
VKGKVPLQLSMVKIVFTVSRDSDPSVFGSAHTVVCVLLVTSGA